MADYREISQEYAKGAINAAILINAGAAVALLTQLSALQGTPLFGIVFYSVIWWTFGVALASFSWLAAFTSTRYVDKSARETGSRARHLRTSNIAMQIGLALIFGSIVCFCCGAAIMAWKATILVAPIG